jgi:transposase, IS6 family
MDTLFPFKWRHFEGDVMPLCVRCYLRYALSYRDVEELAREQGLLVDHATVFRPVQRYASELDKWCRPSLRATNDSNRVDGTYIKITMQRCYLYRAVNSTHRTVASTSCWDWLHNKCSPSLSSRSKRFLHHYRKSIGRSVLSSTRYR